MRKIVFGVWLVLGCITTQLYAQGFGNGSGNGGGNGSGFSVTVKGKILDGNAMPVAQVQVELYAYKQDSLYGNPKTEIELAQNIAQYGLNLGTFKTDGTGNYSGVLARELLMKMRNPSTGISMRTAGFLLRVSKEDFETLWQFDNPSRERADAGLTLTFPALTILKSSEKIDAVEITTKAVEQKGDTTEINAANFKTNPDASAEDLVRKMPGVTTNNGEVEAQGEKVRRVLVDGKPYFGDDPKAALKNVPADAIAKVQIFDAQSEQSQFTGFDDGNTTKTLNIITKMGFKKGSFGKVFVGGGKSIEGSGDDIKYHSGVTYNTFKGDRRLSVLFQTNNINEQNFAVEDIMSVMGGGGGMRAGGNRGGGPPSGTADFFVGGQNGITTTSMLGLNYSDKWGKKVDVTASYFLNNTDNSNLNTTTRYFITGENASNLTYNQDANNLTHNRNHRFNMRLTWKPDSNNMVIVQPRVTFQHSGLKNPLVGLSLMSNNSVFDSTLQINDYVSNNDGYNSSIQLNWMHSFKKKGRSLSLELVPSLNDYSGLNRLSNSLYNSATSNTTELLQRTVTGKLNGSFRTELEFTEQLDSNHGFSLEYNSRVNENSSDRLNYRYMQLAPIGMYEYLLDTLLSNKFTNGYISQATGVRYQYKNYKIRITAGLDAQIAQLSGDQTFPREGEINRTFRSLLPTFSLRSNGGMRKNYRLNYRTSNNAPSVDQLQDVVDNSNPLQLTSGNSKLVQDYQHRLFFRYFDMDSKKGTNYFLMFDGSLTNNQISTLTIIPNGERVGINAGDSVIYLAPGGQLSKPINMNGAYSLRAFFNYGKPLFKGKLNSNLNGGLRFSENPSMIQLGNSEPIRNYSKSPSANLGISLSSNISSKVDFSIYSNSAITQVTNTFQKNLNSSYFTQSTQLRVNFMPKGKWVIGSDITQQIWDGLGGNFYNQTIYLWNASLGRKFGKKNQWDMRFTAYDLLNQNKAFSRNITNTYYEDVRTQVLTRYIMLNVTYNIRKLNGGKDPMDNPDLKRMQMMYPGGRPPAGSWGPGH